MLRRLLVLCVLCLLTVSCDYLRVPGSSSDIDPVATQMAINTKVILRKTAGPTLTAEALTRSAPGATPSRAAPTKLPTGTPSPD